MSFRFPRRVIWVGSCLAIVCTRRGRSRHIRVGDPLMMTQRPLVVYRGRQWKASRLSFHLNVKEVPRTPRHPARGLVLHTCDHSWCVEPSHLYLGTQRDNIRDTLTRHPTLHITRSINMMGNTRARRDNSFARSKPWTAHGISERTWYRRGLNQNAKTCLL